MKSRTPGKSSYPQPSTARRDDGLSRAARSLGVDPRRPALGAVGSSRILTVLGPDMFAPFTAIRVPGRIAWCNFELARQLGFEVPRSNRMTPEFNRRLAEALSYRALQPGEDAEGRPAITMYADKYGGGGVAPALGSARSGFLPFGNLFVKGVGKTPLFKHNDPDDFAHSHGWLPMAEATFEAVLGEVNTDLFTHRSTRILAIVDQGEVIEYPDGRRRPRALAVRGGCQLRPGHVMARRLAGDRSRLDIFLDITRETGQLVTRRPTVAEELPDVKATMVRVIEDHALAAAELFRWRIVHGALSPSNMEMGGGMLDLADESAQPRTAPIFLLDWAQSIYGIEHVERAAQLGAMYRQLLRSMPAPGRERLNARSFDLIAEMERAYTRQLRVKLLGAVGFRPEVARRIRQDHPDTSRRLAELIKRMAELKNPGSVNAKKSVVEHVAVLDVFNLLGRFPEIFFAAPGRHKRSILAALGPVFKGNRFQIAGKRDRVEALAAEFENVYREVMFVCKPLAKQYHGGWSGMQESIKSRAAFENRPIPFIYYSRLYQEANKAVTMYKESGDCRGFQEAIDRMVADSRRNADRRAAEGRSR